MNPLPSIDTTRTQPCRASSFRTLLTPNDLTQDPSYSPIFRSQSSRQRIAPVVLLTSPQPLAQKRDKNPQTNDQQPSLFAAFTKQKGNIKQKLRQPNLSSAQKKNLLELKYTYESLLNPPNIEREIQKWMGSLSNNQRENLCLETWKSYSKTLQNVGAFSAFLQEMRRAFYFDPIHVRFSFTKGVYNSQKLEFARHRLLPVLLAIQNNPTLAEKLFCMAEDGLGACHDRPALTFIDMELETQCFLALQKLEAHPRLSTGASELRQELIHLEAQKYKKQYTISLLIEAFRGATDGDIDPLQTVLINYGKIAKETDDLPTLPYRTCESFVPQEEQTERRKHVVNQLSSIRIKSWQTHLETHLPKTDNWFKVLSMAFPDLQESINTLQDTRLKNSENLIDANTPLDQTYVVQLETINLAYEQQKAELFNNLDVKAFTRQEVSTYLYRHF